jgi:hypothetical protein
MKRPIVNWHRIGGCADSNYTEYLQDVIRQQEKYITHVEKQLNFLNIPDVSISLLKKYMAHVADCEGIDFVDKIGLRPSYQKFSDKEKELLEDLSKEVSNEC